MSTDLTRAMPSGRAARVYMALASHANDSGECWPSWQRLIDTTGLSRRTVARALEDLEDAGMVVSQAQPGRPNRYRIVGERPAQPVPTSASRGMGTDTRPVPAVARGVVPAVAPEHGSLNMGELPSVVPVDSVNRPDPEPVPADRGVNPPLIPSMPSDPEEADLPPAHIRRRNEDHDAAIDAIARAGFATERAHGFATECVKAARRAGDDPARVAGMAAHIVRLVGTRRVEALPPTDRSALLARVPDLLDRYPTVGALRSAWEAQDRYGGSLLSRLEALRGAQRPIRGDSAPVRRSAVDVVREATIGGRALMDQLMGRTGTDDAVAPVAQVIELDTWRAT